MIEDLVSLLIPICICVVLPIAIVYIISRQKVNADNKRTQVIIKALEANKDVDTDKLIESMRKQNKTPQAVLNARLLRGCIYSLIGVFLGIVGTVGLISGAEFTSDQVSIPYIVAGISLALGISYLIVYFVTRKQISQPEK